MYKKIKKHKLQCTYMVYTSLVSLLPQPGPRNSSHQDYSFHRPFEYLRCTVIFGLGKLFIFFFVIKLLCVHIPMKSCIYLINIKL